MTFGLIFLFLPLEERTWLLLCIQSCLSVVPSSELLTRSNFWSGPLKRIAKVCANISFTLFTEQVCENTKAMCPYWFGFSEIRAEIHVPADFQAATATEQFTDGCHQTGGHTTAHALGCVVQWLHLYAAGTVKHGAASGGNSQFCKHLWHCRLAQRSLPCPCLCKMFCRSRLSGQSFPGVSAQLVQGAKGWRDIRESLYSVSCGTFFWKGTVPGLGISDPIFQGLFWTNKKTLAFLCLATA